MKYFLQESIDILFYQSTLANLYLVWPLIIFEVPRYLIIMIIAAFRGLRERNVVEPEIVSFSVVIAGHNGEENIRRCVASLREQTVPPDEILVVSDGSVDNIRPELQKLLEEGIIQGAHHVDLRGGKAAAINLIEHYCTSEILVVCDIDSTLNRHALRNIVGAFDDPSVGAVSGNIVPVNTHTNIITLMQGMEYLVSLTLGRISLDMLDQMSCVSGAFGAFRRTAIHSVGGYDAGSGEDLDLTLRMRNSGWKIKFSENAICYTTVPDTLQAYILQRNRWDGDAISLRVSKHIDTINPLNSRLKISELFHQLDFIFFGVLSVALMPVYFIWLYVNFGSAAPVLGFAAFMLLVIHDFILFSMAVFMSKSVSGIRFLPYILLYSILNTLLVRPMRLQAYIREVVFRTSKKDTFVPQKVRKTVRW